jgi:hypothetical protein
MKNKDSKVVRFSILNFTLGLTQMSDHVVGTLTQFTVYFLQLTHAHFMVMSSGVPDTKSCYGWLLTCVAATRM